MRRFTDELAGVWCLYVRDSSVYNMQFDAVWIRLVMRDDDSVILRVSCALLDGASAQHTVDVRTIGVWAGPYAKTVQLMCTAFPCTFRMDLDSICMVSHHGLKD